MILLRPMTVGRVMGKAPSECRASIHEDRFRVSCFARLA